jgi:hypothetical protein
VGGNVDLTLRAAAAALARVAADAVGQRLRHHVVVDAGAQKRSD